MADRTLARWVFAGRGGWCAQPGSADGLGDGALDSGAYVAAGFPFRCSKTARCRARSPCCSRDSRVRLRPHLPCAACVHWGRSGHRSQPASAKWTRAPAGVRPVQPVPDQAGAEVSQDGEAEAGIAQLQAEEELPVHPGPHLVSGLPVRQPLRELQHRHRRQRARRGRRAATPGKAAAKSSSGSSGPSASRIRMARVPLGNAARTTRAVISGTPSSARGSSDIPPLPSRQQQSGRSGE